MEDTIMKMFIVTGDELCELKMQADGKGGCIVSILGGSEGDVSQNMTLDELRDFFGKMQKPVYAAAMDKDKAA